MRSRFVIIFWPSYRLLPQSHWRWNDNNMRIRPEYIFLLIYCVIKRPCKGNLLKKTFCSLNIITIRTQVFKGHNNEHSQTWCHYNRACVANIRLFF